MEYPEYNFKIYQGEDKELYLAVYTYNKETDIKKYMNFLGSKFIMTFRESISSSPILKLTSNDGDIVLGKFIDGQFIDNSTEPDIIKISFNKIKTKDITTPKLLYDLFQLNDGKQNILLYGQVYIIKSVLYG